MGFVWTKITWNKDAIKKGIEQDLAEKFLAEKVSSSRCNFVLFFPGEENRDGGYLYLCHIIIIIKYNL